MRLLHAQLPCALALQIIACGGESPMAADDDAMEPEPRQLVTAADWLVVPPERDVFVAMRPETVECPPSDGYAAVDFGGEPAFEVHTQFCNYLTVEQPLVDDVAAGELVNVRVWHFQLSAPEPAVGYTAVAVEGAVRWEQEVEIPADSGLLSSGWVTDHELPAGTLVQFHVHNHGFNSWSLIEITAEPG
jgi:hypothetical protein